MILIFTGNGKGKTTSAIGQSIRTAGWGFKTALVFFDKGGNHYGERNTLEILKNKIDVFYFGGKRFDEKTKTFRFENESADHEEAKKAADKVLELLKAGYFLVVCDEIINCLNLGLIEKEQIEKIITTCPQETHLILTGRNLPQWLAEKADLISEIQEIKHYFKKGHQAIKGIEY